MGSRLRRGEQLRLVATPSSEGSYVVVVLQAIEYGGPTGRVPKANAIATATVITRGADDIELATVEAGISMLEDLRHVLQG